MEARTGAYLRKGEDVLDAGKGCESTDERRRSSGLFIAA